MHVVSRRVHVAAVRPAAQPRDDVPGDGPPTPPRDEVQRQLQRSRCVDEPVPARAPSEEEGVRPGQLAVHAVSQSWTEFTRLQRLATLGTLALVFGGVPYVLPVTPLLCVLAYLQVRQLTHLLTTVPTSLTFHSEPQFKSTLALVVLTFWLAEVLAPPRTHNTWPAACSALRWALWSSWRRYTQYEIIAETRLDPKGVYVFGAHPHGVFPLAQWLTINVADERTRQASPIDAAIAAAFPMPCRGAVASIMLRLPVLRHILEWCGVVPASQAVVKTILAEERQSVVLVPGGIAELYQCSQHEEVLVLSQRKGFVRLAADPANACTALVPIFCFGNTSALRLRPPPPKVAHLARRARISVQAFWGRWGTPIPFPAKLLVVVGRPLALAPGESVDELHARYCTELRALFDRHKHRVGWQHKQLRII